MSQVNTRLHIRVASYDVWKRFKKQDLSDAMKTKERILLQRAMNLSRKVQKNLKKDVSRTVRIYPM